MPRKKKIPYAPDKKVVKEKSDLSKEYVIKALELSDGHIAKAAKILNVLPQALGRKIREDYDIAEALYNIKNGFVDMAETALRKAVEKNQAWAIKYTLDCLGKDRGYGRSEHRPNEKGTGIVILPGGLTTEDWMRLTGSTEIKQIESSKAEIIDAEYHEEEE